MKKRYPTFRDINPHWDEWTPPRVHNDPNPNPAFAIGMPERKMSRGELFEYHQSNGTLGLFYELYPESKPRSGGRER